MDTLANQATTAGRIASILPTFFNWGKSVYHLMRSTVEFTLTILRNERKCAQSQKLATEENGILGVIRDLNQIILDYEIICRKRVN